MRILIKTYHYGNNGPPQVDQYKKMGHVVKVLSIKKYGLKEIIKEHEISPLLSIDDLMVPEFGIIKKNLIRFGKRFRISLFEGILIKKICKIIHLFRPDIIIHHSIDYHSYLILKTGFSPQVCIPWSYDSYLEAKEKKQDDYFQYVFQHSDGFIFLFQKQKDFYLKEGGIPESKTRLIRFGVKNLQMISNKNVQRIKLVKELYKIPSDRKLLLDVRGLRRIDGGVFELIRAVDMLKNKFPDIFLILLKGILGNEDIVNQAKEKIKNNGLDNYILLIDSEVEYDDLIALNYLSDIYVSLLPKDQFGLSISEAILTDNLLVLSNLEHYKDILGNHAEYACPGNVKSIVDAIEKTLLISDEEKMIRMNEAKKWVKEADFEKNAQKRIEYYEELVGKLNK